MAKRYKKNGIVEISSGLMGENAMLIDSPEFEVTQGRQVNGIAYIGTTYYYKQGNLERSVFVEYPIPFVELNETEMNAILALITSANVNILAMVQHIGATEV